MPNNNKIITVSYNQEFIGWESIESTYSVPSDFNEFDKSSMHKLLNQTVGDLIDEESLGDNADLRQSTDHREDIKIISVKKNIAESEFKKLATDTALLSFNDLGEISFVFDELSADDKITNEQILSFHSDLVSQIEFYGDQPDADFSAFEVIEEASAVLLSTLPDQLVEGHLDKLNKNTPL